MTSRQIDVLRKITDERIAKLKKGDELPPGVIKLVKVYIAMKRKLSVGDKMAGRHGNKGVIARIVPKEDMPYMPDGTPDGNRAQSARRSFAYERRTDSRNAPRLGFEGAWRARRESPRRHRGSRGCGSQMVQGRFRPHFRLEDARRSRRRNVARRGRKASAKAFRSPRRFLTARAKATSATCSNSRSCRKPARSRCYDGMTGDEFAQNVTVGYIYMLKLSHLVDDKIHARSIGPYSLITQQPLGGKAQFGGQRFGEMEVWALEAYGAAHILQELLTAKSDDVYGRAKIYEAIVKGEPGIEPGVPESFNVLVRELQSLCLDVELMKRQKPQLEKAEAAD